MELLRQRMLRSELVFPFIFLWFPRKRRWELGSEKQGCEIKVYRRCYYSNSPPQASSLPEVSDFIFPWLGPAEPWERFFHFGFPEMKKGIVGNYFDDLDAKCRKGCGCVSITFDCKTCFSDPSPHPHIAKIAQKKNSHLRVLCRRTQLPE